MRSYINRLLIINALVCAVFGALFAVPLGRLEIGLVVGLVFGIVTALFVEVIFRRWHGRWLYRRRLIFLVLLEVLLTLYLLMPAYLAYFGLRPARRPVGDIPAELAALAETVSITTRDGTLLSGWYLPPQNGSVVIALHGLGSNRLEVLPHARILLEHGYGILMTDLRAHGASGGEVFADGWNAPEDVQALVDFLRSRAEVEQIAALGLSVGAVSMLQAGAEIDAIQAFIADGTGVSAAGDLLDPLTPHPAIAWLLVPDYWISYRFTAWFTGMLPAPPLREQVRRIAPRPILFIAGAESMWEPELAEKYARAAGDTAQVWVVPGAGHIAGVHTATSEYRSRILSFLDEALPAGET